LLFTGLVVAGTVWHFINIRCTFNASRHPIKNVHMKAFFITLPVCLVAMIIVFAITKRYAVDTRPVGYTKQIEDNKPISQQVIAQSDSSNSTGHINDTIEKESLPVDTNAVNKVAETDKAVSSDPSSSSLPSPADQKPKQDDSKNNKKSSVRKIAMNARENKQTSIEFGDISSVTPLPSNVADKHAEIRQRPSDIVLVKKN
jgi:hypothetical protein